MFVRPSTHSGALHCSKWIAYGPLLLGFSRKFKWMSMAIRKFSNSKGKMHEHSTIFRKPLEWESRNAGSGPFYWLAFILHTYIPKIQHKQVSGGKLKPYYCIYGPKPQFAVVWIEKHTTFSYVMPLISTECITKCHFGDYLQYKKQWIKFYFPLAFFMFWIWITETSEEVHCVRFAKGWSTCTNR